jgi:hypothetical protein
VSSFKDFNKLLIVCLKMLFRKTTRKRFIFLVTAFIFMMGFNSYSYVMRFHKTEVQKKEILNEKAFKVFFLRSRSAGDCNRFILKHSDKLLNFGADIVKKAFIYQSNLYIHFYSLSSDMAPDDKNVLNFLYDLFNIRKNVHDFFLREKSVNYDIKINANYFDYYGTWLSDDIIRDRHKELRRDLVDIADMIRGDLGGKRLLIFNNIKNRVADNISRLLPDSKHEPNPYLSRLESIIPMNFLYLFSNLRDDTTTDIMDLNDSVTYGDDATFHTFENFLSVPAMYKNQLMYYDISIYPRYIPIYTPDVLRPRWSWLLYEDIAIKTDLMKYLNQLHFKGNYMFSYEKSHIMKDKVKKINDDIHSNHANFYLSDLSIGIAFPFMISLFAFIHLKTELSFLFMFKNRIRELLFIFWLLPVALMLIVKAAVLTGYVLNIIRLDIAPSMYIIYSLTITFIIASILFYPINLWCFSQFTGNKIDLYALHKGR